MADAAHYTYRVVWSEEDDEFVGTVAEFPSLSWLEEDQVDALSGITNLVSEVLEDMKKSGETPPLPLSERNFSGKFMVRTSPSVHRRLAVEAHEQGVSLNMLINQKLSGAGGVRPDYGMLKTFAPFSGKSYAAVSDAIKSLPVPFAPGSVVKMPLANIRPLADLEVPAGLTLGWYVDESSKEDSSS
jgi:predicted HicB family RNase H-like nuclease